MGFLINDVIIIAVFCLSKLVLSFFNFEINWRIEDLANTFLLYKLLFHYLIIEMITVVHKYAFEVGKMVFLNTEHLKKGKT